MSGLGSLIQLGLALIALALAAMAQYLHTFESIDAGAVALFIVALGCWTAALFIRRIDLTTRLSETTLSEPRSRNISLTLVGCTIVLAILTFLFSGGNQFREDNVLAWTLAVLVFLYTFWEPEKDWHAGREWLRERAKQIPRIRISPSALMLVLLTLVAIAFYYHNLDGVPAEMTSDHAEKLLDVNDIAEGGMRPIFLVRNTGREPLQFYLTAALVNLTGHPIDYMALKLITAALGVLVVPFTFLFVRELFDDDVAFITALFIAFSKWSWTIARMGLRFPLTPVFIAPLLFFLFRALKHRRRNDFMIAGLILGAGLYGYNAFRIAPFLIALFLLLWLVVQPPNRLSLQRYIVNGILLFGLMIVTLMPLVRYMVDEPGEFWYRMITRLTDIEQTISANPLQVLAGNVFNVALMFNWRGDEVWPNSIPYDPALEPVTGALFLLGLVFAWYRFVRYQEMTYAFVLIGLGVMLLPSVLSIAFPNENPSVVRTGGAIPFVFVLAALPLAWFARAIRRAFPNAHWSRIAAFAFVGLILLVSLRANATRYFHDFDASYRANAWNSSEVATAIRGYADQVDLSRTWILHYPHWVDTRNVAINLHAIGWEQTLNSGEDARAHAQDAASKLYIVNIGDYENLAQLKEVFPNGQIRAFHSRTPGKDFLLYYVPGTLPDQPLGTK